MENNEEGHSVQAVSVTAEGSFVVDEEAVRRVVTRAETRGLPVAVVTVAGATRGGKSFLLDFFLRYLHAPVEARNDGSWLGADDEPLRGFSWRGGFERDTNGIVIWSEPIITTLESGEQAAVLLMDTQGTFDTQTTFEESTTIFALSTLLSSTLIYNLSQNIKEDDLEHLQFFAEYGKMASGEGEKSFQVLQFLVRDWSYAYQHPIGPVGGQNLLDVKLKEVNCKEKLKEIRRQIKASFESIRCFLMPHPGLKVATSPNFKGCLADISDEFKIALLELTSLLLHPKNLVLKNINGESVLTEDLLEYLKTYVDVFNSDELPTPVNILKATGEASLEVTAKCARTSYREHVQRTTCSHVVSRAALSRLHDAAIQLAKQTFTTRKMLITPERQDQRLQELLLELEGNLPHYITINEEKLRALFAECEAIFDGRLQQSSCLTLTELVEVHREAVDAAMDHFDDVLCASGDDEVRSPLLMKLKEYFSRFEAENANRIRDIIIESKALYEEVLLGNSANDSSRVCVSPNRLERRHLAARIDAERYFTDHFTSEHNANNQHKEELLQFIETRWSEISMVNATNNSAAVRQALEYYNATMNELFSNFKCLHPSDLDSEHMRVRALTIARFNDARTETSDEEEDYYTNELETKLRGNFSRFEAENANRIRDTIIKSKALYEEILLGSSGNDSSLVCVSPNRLERRHLAARIDAERYFTDHFTSEHNVHNKHKEELLQFIETRWSEISMVNATNNSNAVRQALEYYNETMNELFFNSRCLHPSDLQSEHMRVRALTIARFNDARTETSDEEEDHYTNELETELEGSLPHYISINEEKLRLLFAECEAILEGRLQQSSCLTRTELVEVHREAVDAAMDHFDDVLRASGDNEGIDEVSSPLLMRLRDNFSRFEAENANRIRDTIIKSKALYEEVLLGPGNDSSRVCVSPNWLEQRHLTARIDAERYFTEHFTSEHNANNQYKEELLQFIETRWSEISMVNATNNSAAVEQAIEYYNETMNELFSDSKCLHPSDLDSEHMRVRALTITRFNDARTETSDEEEDYYTYELETDLEIQYQRKKELNLTRNEQAVVKAHELYKRLMNITEGFLSGVYAVISTDMNFLKHSEVKSQVMNVFHTEYRRQGNGNHDIDDHDKKLNDLINSSLKWHVMKTAGALAARTAIMTNLPNVNEVAKIFTYRNKLPTGPVRKAVILNGPNLMASLSTLPNHRL